MNTALHYSAMHNFPEIALALVRFASFSHLHHISFTNDEPVLQSWRRRGPEERRGEDAGDAGREGAERAVHDNPEDGAGGEGGEEPRDAAFLASMRDYDHAIKATTVAKDLPASMRAERATELQTDGTSDTSRT